jgi:flagellar biosynthesis/type III secretory pathway M-ring protein FliF/YscJ
MSLPLGRKEDSLMKTMLSFSIVIVCLISLFMLVPIAGAQETEAAEDQETEAAEDQEAEAAENQEASQEDKIAAEKERLEAKIAELEEKPLEYFGSQKNKRTRIGFYKYRLETLEQDPDKYFSQPEKFEGNVKGSD